MASVFQNLWNGIKSWWNGATGQALTGAQQQANQFSAQQAQIARDWDEKMYTQYNSPGALVSQYQSAGINPALMFGGQTPAAPSSSGAAPSVSPSSPGFDMLGALAQLAQLRSQIDLTKAQTANVDADTSGKEIENAFKPSVFSQNLRKGEFEISNLRAGIAKISAEIAKFGKDIELSDSQIALNAAHGALALAQSNLAESNASYISSQKFEQDWINGFIDRWNFRPNATLFTIPLDMLAAFGDTSDQLFNKAVSKIKGIFKPSDQTDAGTLVGMLCDAGLDDRSIVDACKKFGVKFKDSVSELWDSAKETSSNAGNRIKNILSYGIF